MKYIEDEKGAYIHRVTKVHYRRVGEPIPFDVIIENMAHEIAHLKFWNHLTSHYCYTNHIKKLIQEELRGGVEE